MKTPSYFELRDVQPDYYKNQHSKLPAWLEKYISSLPRDVRILDYGCGFGQIIKSLSLMGFDNVIGVDIDQKAMDYVNEEGFCAYHVEELPRISAEKFDIIIMSHVLEHIQKEKIIPTLTQISQILSEDGRLILMVPNAQSNTGSYWRWEDFTHEWLFTSGSVKYVLKSAGFNSVEFIDVDATHGLTFLRKWLRKVLLWIYIKNITIWNKVTSSSYHHSSPQIFSYEIKVVAKRF